MIMMEGGPSTHGFDQSIVYYGAYEGASEAISSWTENDDMVYNHHCCLKGPMLPMLPDGVQMLL